ncbi:conidial pigment biosynthesis oxidase Abr1/brown 1 [Rhizodiscina lignyota]|uniref:Conidial pigment biosynthesis oxidase Abr1/brown 1 n=1 Tax=Rhizodiscina lignyota TaxID=1504668 RepID=A0A9P4IBJ6_9PEZI|nr:conidial pigment biosynthesis oxidase Abr1/brown 1 [Rhizodiscina lignyota]
MGILLPLVSFISLAAAKTVTFDWSIDWVTAAPDGYARPVIGINGKWPCPSIEVDNGDLVVLNLKNNLGNETTGIHCHGEFQTGTADMDGVPSVSQCPIQPGGTFTHQFTANPAGTHWFHSHSKGQYPDGIRGPMIVHDPAWEKSLGVDAQYTITVSDWYHQQAPYLVHQMLTTGKVPIPDSSLMNDAEEGPSFDILPGKKYLFRIISMSAFMAHTIEFQGHKMSVVAVDGAPVKPANAEAIEIGAGQRYDVVITAKTTTNENYGIYSRMIDSLLSNTATLKYTDKPLLPLARIPATLPGVPIDDMTLVPTDNQPLLEPVTETIELDVHYIETKAGPRMTFGNESYIAPKVPSLYTALTTGEEANNPAVYGFATNPYVVQQGDVVQVVINNLDEFPHPIHLHGHRFQVVARGVGKWDGNTKNFPKVPMKRDTATTVPGGHLVIRFQANNPGVWPIHCHMEWHMEAGMRATIIEAPTHLQQLGITIPEDHLAICRAQNIPTEGNCAGKTGSEDTWGSLIDPPAEQSLALKRKLRLARRALVQSA